MFSGTRNGVYIWHCGIVLFVAQADVLTFQRTGGIAVSGVITGLVTQVWFWVFFFAAVEGFLISSVHKMVVINLKYLICN